MISPIDDGGPAFPQCGFDSQGRDREVMLSEFFSDAGGMSLRDYFAAKFAQQIYAGEGARGVADRDKRYDETNWAEIVADNAYLMADAMIARRKK